MEENQENKQDADSDSLESPSTIVETEAPAETPDAIKPTEPIPITAEFNEAKPKDSFFNKLFEKFDIYIVIFLVLVFLAGIVTFFVYRKTNQQPKTTSSNVSTESIDDSVLDQLKQSDVQLGDPEQILSVESNAVFAGTVLVKGDFEVAGRIKIGGPLAVSSINVAESGTFNDLQANGLTVSGNTQLQGNVSIENNLTVGGSGSFGGSLTAATLNIQNLEISGNISVNRHIDAGGPTPSKSNGNALGSGGSSSISGTDTAGTVNISTGNSPNAGCFANIRFSQSFNATPHIAISPVGSTAGKLDYYITRTSTGFSICTANSAPSGKNFSFDYVVID